MRYYEAIYIVHPNLEDAGLTKVVEATKKALSKRGGELLYEENMGKKRLAYAVEKQRFGTYILLQFQGEGVDNSRFSQDLELNDDIIAQMIVSIDEEEIRTPTPKADENVVAAESDAKAEVKPAPETVADKATEEPEKEVAEEETSTEPAEDDAAKPAAAEESTDDAQEAEETGTDAVTEVDAEADSPA